MMRQYELVERVVKYDPDADEDLLNRAYVYAMRAHGNQKRASGEAYFNHPLEVAAILTEMKLDTATIAAGAYRLAFWPQAVASQLLATVAGCGPPVTKPK